MRRGGEGVRKGTHSRRDRGITEQSPGGLMGTKPQEAHQLNVTLPVAWALLSAAQPVPNPTPHPSHLGCFVVPVEGGLVVAKIEDVTFDLRVCKGSHSKAHYSHDEA